jgi:hypothetical protein
MASNSKMEIKKFNGKCFELWKIKMEDLLVEKDQWITVDLGNALTLTSTDDWKKLDRKVKSTIRLCLSRFNITQCVRGSYNQGFMR